jgi:hypothetical protein
VHRLLITIALGLMTAVAQADYNGYSTNNGTGNGYPNNNGSGNGYPNNNGNGNGNGYGNNRGGAGFARVVQKFNGTDTKASTAAFTVQDKWELLWFSPRPVNITLLNAADGNVITGAHGAGKGSLYQPKGGTYYIQVESDIPGAAPWYLLVAEVGAGTRLSDSDGGQIFSNPMDANYAPPATVLPPNGFAQSGPNISPNNPGAPQTPFGQPNMGGSPSGPAPVVKLSEDQARAVVLIKGDNAEGTGFLIKTPDGPQVVTNIHVIANNPNLKITTSTGALIRVLSSKGASDRDLAMLAIKDAGYNYLEVAADISKTVQTGDEVVTPGNSQGGEVMLNTGGKVLGIGPERIEFDNPIYHGNSGGPVFHTKSGTVLGVVTEAMKVDMSNDLDKASFSSRNSAISGQMRYFGLRLDTVTAWVAIDSRQFQIETAFLDQFHEQSRRLDAYLNPPKRNVYGYSNNNEKDDQSNIYLSDEKLMKALDGYHERASGADVAQKIDALRGLLFDLQSIADLNVNQIKNANNFYSFDQERARDELDYRKALKAELDSIGSNVERMGNLPRTNN